MRPRLRRRVLVLLTLPAVACNMLAGSSTTATPQQPLPTATAQPTAPLPVVVPTYGPPPAFVPLPDSFPRIERQPAPAIWPQARPLALPAYDPASTAPFSVDLRNSDLSRLDLRQDLETLLAADFDSRTLWPESESMPSGFDPAAILGLGANPGLGLRSLHAQGITGRN